nr:acyltransferase family protein [Aeromicrobium wangtongii]
MDGLRAVAVIAVIIFHGPISVLPGGWLGVDLFFVISGFLITTLLLTERDRWGSTDFVSFWAGRARRLFPALAVMIAVVLLLSSVLTMPARRPAIGSDALAAIGYIANWNFLSSGEAYFGAVTEPSPLLHTWSLAVEEQFYIVFPFIVVLLTRFCGRRMRGVVLAAVAILSAAWMAYLYDPALPPDRVYYGTDTRAHELLIGSACAALLLIDERVTQRVAAACRWLAIPAVLVVVAAFVGWDESRAFTFRGGLVIFSVLSAIVIVACWTRAPGRLTQVLGSTPMRSIGLISYGLYLWHWPVMVFLDEARAGFGGVGLLLVQLALTAVVAAASYRWIEMPIRRNGWSALIPRDRQAARVIVLATVPALVVGAIVLPQSPWYVRPASAGPGGDVRVAADAPGFSPAPMTLYLLGDSVPAGLTGYFPSDQHPNIAIRSAVTPACHDPFPGLRVLDGRAGGDFLKCPEFVDRLGSEITDAQPDVVAFFVTQSMVFDRELDDRVIPAGTPEYRRFITKSLTELHERVMSSGAKNFAVVTLACHQLPAREGDYVERLNDNRRVRWINDVTVDWARAHDVPVIDQNALLCAGGAFHDTINGRQMYEDHIHFSPEGSRELWKWLAPKLSAVAGGAA